MRLKRYAMILAASVMTIGAAAPIAAESAGTARFAAFRYEGHDDYYARTPLAEGEFYNPVLPGWNSDPSVVRVGDDYWLVTSTFGYYPGVPLYHSPDLVNWTLVRNILDRPSQLSGLPGQSIDKGGIYAPQISYNPRNGLFYMVTTDVGRQEGHFYVTARDPRGDWSEPTFLKGIDGIDPSFFFDADGKSYVVYKEDTSKLPKWSPYRCIRFIEFDEKSGNTIGESWPLYEADTADDEHLDRAEGPHLYRIGSKYFLLTAEGGTGDQHSANIYYAENLRGPWKRSWRSPILTQRTLKPKRSNPVTCSGHADFVQTPAGDWWAVFLAQRPGPAGHTALGRETFLMPVRWSPDSIPYITQNTDTVPLHLAAPHPGTRLDLDRPDALSGNFVRVDNFDGDALSPEWFGLRGSTADYCKLQKVNNKTNNKAKKKGNGKAAKASAPQSWLELTCSAEKVSGKGVPAYVSRRVCHHAFTAETSMAFAPENEGERAGLMVLKNGANQFFLANDGKTLRALKMQKGGEECLGEVALPENLGKEGYVDIRIESDGKEMKFSWRPDAASEWSTIAEGADASHISGERTGGFTGATVGFYAEK